MARAQIPLDDEPVDIDLGDLPTDEELEAAASVDVGPGGDADGYEGPSMDEASALGLFQLWAFMVAILYVVAGFGVGLYMAFQGTAKLGFAAMTHPQFYLVVLFWPIALWKLFWGQY